ncbi:MAG: DUF58 domain-containing protein [Armatimonadetes bacterium]|nr:DUF58 domain-containing protein [Armatimonadota bacterium]
MTAFRIVILCVALLLLAYWLRIEFFPYAVYAMLGVLVISLLMGRSALQKVELERHCSRAKAEIGENATVSIEVRNRKALPIPWLIIEDVMPRRLESDGERALALLMLPFGRKSMKYRVHCKYRGYHQIGPTVLESGDFFGLVRRFLTGSERSFITVYPKVVPIGHWGIRTRRPIGEVIVRQRLHEDPTRLAGVRYYQRGDPLNRIHWPATARTGELHSRVYEHSTLIGANIVLDLHQPSWETASEKQVGTPGAPPTDWFDNSEFAITVAASLAAFVIEQKQCAGFITNGGDAAERVRKEIVAGGSETRTEAMEIAREEEAVDRLRPVEVPPQKGDVQWAQLMETFAHLEVREGLTCAQLISDEYEGWPREASLLIIVPALGPGLLQQIARLRDAGFLVTVFVIRNEEDYIVGRARLAAEHIDVVHLRTERDLDQVAVAAL